MSTYRPNLSKVELSANFHALQWVILQTLPAKFHISDGFIHLTKKSHCLHLSNETTLSLTLSETATKIDEAQKFSVSVSYIWNVLEFQQISIYPRHWCRGHIPQWFSCHINAVSCCSPQWREFAFTILQWVHYSCWKFSCC